MRWLLALLLISIPVHAETADPRAGDLEQAVRLFRLQELDAAEALLLDLEKARPEDAEIAFYLGRVHLARGQAQVAVAALERATRFDPASSIYQFWLAEALVIRVDEMAFVFKLGIANRIRAAYEKAVELDPDNIEARVAVARYHSEAPVIAGGNPATAQQQLDEIGRRDPALGHVTRALIHERLDRPEEAEAELEMAVSVDPESTIAWRETGLFHQRRQRWEMAQRAFDEVLKREPSDPVALYEAARAALEISERQLARAAAALETYLRDEPAADPMVFSEAEPLKRSVAHQRLGRVYERQGRPELAAQLVEAGGLVDEGRFDVPPVDAARPD